MSKNDNNILLKPSMFNYHMYCSDGMMLYNSYGGKYSVLYVEKENEDIVLQLLTSQIVKYDKTNKVMEKLYQAGYLIESNCDEKCLRQKLHIDALTEGTLSLVIHTTEACNFRCKYCYMDFQTSNMPTDVQDKIITFIAQKLVSCTGLNISWFGGEPLLGLEVINNISQKAIEICKKLKKPYSSSITTNGYLLTPEVFWGLYKNRVTSYTITLDGLKDLHDSYRVLVDGRGTFDQIIKNLLYIRDNTRSCALSIHIRSNITSKFYDRIEEYVRFYDELFGNDKRFSFFIRPVDNWGGERVKELENELITYSGLGELYKHISQLTHKLDFSPALSGLEWGGNSCMALCKNKYTISIAGYISKCDEADGGNGELSIGNVMNKNNYIDDVLHAKWLYANMSKAGKCEDCFYSIPCLKGCCPKHVVLSDRMACPLNYEELDGLIQLAGMQTKADRV